MSVIDHLAVRDRIVARGGAVTMEELHELLAAGPSGALAFVLEVIDPTRVMPTDCERADDLRLLLLQLSERQVAWSTALSLTLTQAFSAAALACDAGDPFAATRSTIVSEVALVSGVSGDTADARLGTAVLLSPSGLLADTHAALSRGWITPSVARALADATWELTPEQITEVQARVLPRLLAGIDHATGVGCPKNYSRARESIARVLMRVAPDRAKRRREQAHQERGVKFRLLPESGLAQITAFVTAASGIAIWENIQLLAETEQAHDKAADAAEVGVRTLNQCRADVFEKAFAHLVDVVTQTGSMPASFGPRVRVGVLIDLPTLLALREGTGEIPGYGPIDPELAQILAADSEWQRFIHDPLRGELLDLGRVSYSPSVRLREFIHARDPRCTFPGCSRRSHRSQLDHIVPWPQGPTDRANLHPLCVHHHNLKTHGRWQVRRDPDTGETRWRSPHGLLGHTPNAFDEMLRE